MIADLLLVLFAVAAVVGAVLMIVVRHPMRVALALIATMISLGGIYGLLGVHVIAVFQIMICCISDRHLGHRIAPEKYMPAPLVLMPTV